MVRLLLRLSILLSAAVALLAGRPAFAQDFFNLSPGPLAKGHAKWDNNDECKSCHEIGGGVTKSKCLSCHDHQPLGKKIKTGKGLHAKHKNKKCQSCHTDHKGRAAAITDWKKVGGRSKFNHVEQTGFSLAGLHADVACTKCHLKKLSSGRTSYFGLPRSCKGCHKNEPHRFTTKSLLGKCESCHPKGGGSANRMKPNELPFDHKKPSGLALVGKHKGVACLKCHKGARMSLKPKRKCAGCHKSPHGRSLARSDCQSCHAEKDPWSKSAFDHDKTDFRLRGGHAIKNCSKCHKRSKKAKAKKSRKWAMYIPKVKCAGCHRDPHKKRFAKSTCESCHGAFASKKRLAFKHKRETKFPLTGKHKGLKCRDCHRGRRPHKFEKFEDGMACMGCHSHAKAHDGQFDDKACLNCHKEGGTKELDFDHQKDTRFPLTGLHLEIGDKCDKCHPKGLYKTDKLECEDCHEDSHKGELGADCAKCHTTAVHFKETNQKFEHNKLTEFPLVGLHVGLECDKCHPKKRYKIEKSECVDCHQEDDPHQGQLGADCAKCHEVEKGAPKFDHDRMTDFALTGFHKTVECAYCHQPKKPNQPALAVGWTKSVPKPKLDQHFPIFGKDCADCHADVHNGSYGKQCGSCHNTEDFKQATRAVHDTGAFRLQGLHDRLLCARCHQSNRRLTGVGELCQTCHLPDDVHNGSLGPRCGQCHQQQDWRPPRFNHSSVGYVLRGAHRTTDCRDCHSAGRYAGTPQDCQICHTPAAMQVPDPVHGVEMTECQNCHFEAAFAPARPYHPWYVLRGQHAMTDCRNCHENGTYAGTPSDCSTCHIEEYNSPQTKPPHMMAGLPTTCELCHSETTWTGALYQHQAFVRRGTHRVIDCDACHPGDRYDGAFGGSVAGFDCISCHGPGTPKAEWPMDHEQQGFPMTCELCHTELGWTPARRPN